MEPSRADNFPGRCGAHLRLAPGTRASAAVRQSGPGPGGGLAGPRRTRTVGPETGFSLSARHESERGVDLAPGRQTGCSSPDRPAVQVLAPTDRLFKFGWTRTSRADSDRARHPAGPEFGGAWISIQCATFTVQNSLIRICQADVGRCKIYDKIHFTTRKIRLQCLSLARQTGCSSSARDGLGHLGRNDWARIRRRISIMYRFHSLFRGRHRPLEKM
jgi:hypothetical protein